MKYFKYVAFQFHVFSLSSECLFLPIVKKKNKNKNKRQNILEDKYE